MRIKALLAATALSASGLVALTSQPAVAGCGVTLDLHNNGPDTVVVHIGDSDVRTKTGWWSKLGSGNTTVQPYDTVSKAFTFTFSCNAERRYRLWVEKNGSTYWRYEPSATTYTTSTNPHVDVN